MSKHAKTSLADEKLYLEELGTMVSVPGILLGIAGLGGAFLLARTRLPREIGWSHFLHAYLVAFCFFLSVTLGALYFIIVHYLTRAGWSVTVRRLAEGLIGNFWLLLVLVIPIVAGESTLYAWANPHFALLSPLEYAKKPGVFDYYLNPTAFHLRLAVYFIGWLFLANYLRRKSLRQDLTGDPQLTRKMEQMSTAGIFFLGFSLTFCAFDLIMSLDYTWFSTIFGVYFFAGSALSFYATLALLCMWLQRNGRMKAAVTPEHYQDLGKWMFAFTFFWGYVAFSQYMLIWYADLPEETSWFRTRQAGPWLYVALILLFVQLVIPFLGLLSRHTKRRVQILSFWAVWTLAAHYIDLLWQIIPQQWIDEHPTALASDPHKAYTPGYGYSAMDGIGTVFHAIFSVDGLICIGCLVGIGGFYAAFTMFSLRNASLVPLKDPRLPEALAFENM